MNPVDLILFEQRAAQTPRRLPVYTWATRPAAASWAGALIRVSDIGLGAGSIWISDGTSWRPLNGAVTLYMLMSDATMALNANEQILTPAIALPPGLIQSGFTLRFTMGWDKAGGSSDQLTARVRVGTTGTTADTAIHSPTIGTTNQSSGSTQEFQRTADDAIQKNGGGAATTVSSLSGTVAAARASASTIGNMDTTTNYLIVTGKMNTGSAEYGVLHSFNLELMG